MQPSTTMMKIVAFLSYSVFDELHYPKVAQNSFSGSIPPKFEHKLRRHKQDLEKLPPQLY